MAPEAVDGPATVGAPADVYALGVLLYEALAGRPPFRAPTVRELLRAHRTQVPEPLPDDVPRPLADAVMACLAKQPADRPTAASMGAMLEPLAAPASDDVRQKLARRPVEPLETDAPESTWSGGSEPGAPEAADGTWSWGEEG